MVAIYMPMLLELPIAMLACARIGAVHSVVFAGFSAEALSGKMFGSSCRQVSGIDACLMRCQATRFESWWAIELADFNDRIQAPAPKPYKTCIPSASSELPVIFLSAIHV